MLSAQEVQESRIHRLTGVAPSTLLGAGPIARYGVAIVLTGVALWLSLTLVVSFGNPFWFFFPTAVIASTWFCGKFPGWLTTAISIVLVQYYFIPPLRSFAITVHALPEDVPGVVEG
jgi:K+-sensing histidine kinase KdpD